MKVAAILQSRMTSTRLPGKSLIDIHGKPLTAWILERAGRCRRFDEIVLAIPDKPEDDPLAERFAGVCRVHRGSLHDVLDRYWGAARSAGADLIVRITGDNPLLDPPVMDAAVDRFLSQNIDFGNTVDCPLGIGAEIFTFAALDRAHREAKETYQREHVAPYLYESPGRFRTAGLDVSEHVYGLGKQGIRLTVDTQEDLDLVREIYARLLPVSPEFCLKEIADMVRTAPDLFRKNIHVRQKSFKESET